MASPCLRRLRQMCIRDRLEMGHQAGIIPQKPNVEFAGDAAVTAKS